MARSESPIRLAMLFDNSSSVLIARDFEREAAERFFRRVIRPDRDKAALFSVADYTRLEQPITSDVSLLTAAIERFPDPKGATALLDGIIEVAEYLRSVSGRRVVVIVSDGEDTYSDMTTTLEGVIQSLLSNDCQVYVVKTKDFENYKRTGIRGGNANIRALTAERRMIEIAQQTGGAVYSPIDEDEMNTAFNRISAELSQQYILSYYPDDTADRGGEFRGITLSVKNRTDLTVRTRQRVLRSEEIMLNAFLEQFLQHLKYERNLSPHTLRNYASDLDQFKLHLFSVEKRDDLSVTDIDRLTIREWMASLHDRS